MIAWLRSAADAPKGRRKLTGLVWSLLAVVVLALGSDVMLRLLPAGAWPHVVSIAIGGCASVAGLFGALVGGNAAEHRAAVSAPPEELP